MLSVRQTNPYKEALRGYCINHKSEAQAALDDPRCWRCESHGITAKESYMQGVDPDQQREVFVGEK